MSNETGKLIILIGGVILVIGIIIYFFNDHLRWIGRLPGDIRIEKENFSFYFPITSMILFSILVTILFRVLKKLF